MSHTILGSVPWLRDGEHPQAPGEDRHPLRRRYCVSGRTREKSLKKKVDAVKFRATVEADLARGDWIDDRRSKQTVAEAWFATLGGHRQATRTRTERSLTATCCQRSASRSATSTSTPVESRCNALRRRHQASSPSNIPTPVRCAEFHYPARSPATSASCADRENATRSSGQRAPAGPAAKATSVPGISHPPPSVPISPV